MGAQLSRGTLQQAFPKGVEDRGPSSKKRAQGDGGPTRPLDQVERALRTFLAADSETKVVKIA
jgi:hypothetical protein